MLNAQTLALTALKPFGIQPQSANRYQSADGIVRFVQEVLHANPAPYQVDILRAFVDHRRACVRAPHGVGKTALSSWIILWSMVAFDTDVKVVTTASAWRQLTHFTWREVRKWASHADWQAAGVSLRYGKELMERSIKIGNREAFAVASDNPALIEGAHASKLVYVFDEAKSIRPETWDAAEGAFSTGDCYALAISTPGASSGRFYDIQRRARGLENWQPFHITMEQAIAAGRMRPEWVEDCKNLWGENSAIYKNRVLGEFADDEANVIIPLSWVEKANERFYEWQENKPDDYKPVDESYGLDVARMGDDKSALAHKQDNAIASVTYWTKQDTMQTTGNVTSAIQSTDAIAVDVDGVGAGVVDRLRELDYNVAGVHAGEKAAITDVTGERRFVNMRSALWWLIRDSLDPEGDILLALPKDDLLTADLTAPTYSHNSTGAIVVEKKEDTKKRILQRSPDGADAVALALYAPLVCGLEGFGSNDF